MQFLETWTQFHPELPCSLPTGVLTYHSRNWTPSKCTTESNGGPIGESEDTAITVTIAPDETCGYVGGNEALPSNTFNLLCTTSNRPFCRTYVYPSGIFDYECASTTVEGLVRVRFTFERQKSPKLSIVTLTDGASEGLGEPVTVTVQGKATGSPSAVTVYMIPQPPSESTTTSEPSSSSNKSPPIGAIVGGVVGGAAVLGLIGLGAFCLVRRQKRNSHQGGSVPTGQPNMAHPMDQSQYPYHSQHQGLFHPTPMSVCYRLRQWMRSPGPAYEMVGSEAREPEPVYEMVGDSSGRK
ncbi:hypothetical protein FBULB1_6054 [Fusarium bulbicola]|nr:hypothetical protein FBULB1_6054 [Fusarium bulbicola]